jgi:hypothetical protein
VALIGREHNTKFQSGKPLERPRRRCEDNIKMGSTEMV